MHVLSSVNKRRLLPAALGLLAVITVVVAMSLFRSGSADGDSSAARSTVGTPDQPAQADPPVQPGDPTPAIPADPKEVYDPVAVGEELPSGYRSTLPRDAIRPIYEPEFTDAAGVDWSLETLVIGVAGEDEVKAYPVAHLNSREMVNDFLEGEPILVTW